MFSENLDRRIQAIVIQLAQADKPGISNVARSSYYRSAIFLMCTAIEGMVYELVKKQTTPPHIIDQAKKFVEVQKVSGAIATDIYLCKKNIEDICIDDVNVGFGKLNVYLKNKGLVSLKEYRMLDFVRKERNKVHLQGVDSTDTGYTKAKFNRISRPVGFLLSKIS